MSLKTVPVAAVLPLFLVGALALGAGAPPASPVTTAAPAAPAAPSVHAAATGAAEPVRYVVAPRGNEARYYVREQLARISFPSDAIGVTRDITGGVSFDQTGRIVPAQSRIVVDLRSLKSDRDMRDGFIQRRTLQTEQYPTAELVPTSIEGAGTPFPSSGERAFKVTGNLTVHGVTRATTWLIQARFDSTGARGVAVTGFTFADFGLEKPRVMSVLSVADSIHLEYDFNLVAAGAPVN